MATWTKLKSGDWGVLVDGTVSVGSIIEVRSKAGVVKSVKIEKVVSTGNGKSICAIEGATQAASTEKIPGGGRYTGKVCKVCGHREYTNSRGYVDGDRIYRSGECQSCFEERKMGY